MRSLSYIAIAVCVCTCAAIAGAAADRALVSVRTVDAVVAPGDSVSLPILCIVRSGYHVQANPPSNEFLIPLEVTLAPADSLVTWRAVYPPPVPFDVGGETLLTYHDSVRVVVIVSVPARASKGELEIPASLRYQACDNRRCFAPTDESFTVTLEVR